MVSPGRKTRKTKREKERNEPTAQSSSTIDCSTTGRRSYTASYTYIYYIEARYLSYFIPQSIFGCKYTESSSLYCNIKTSFYPIFYQMCRDTLFLQQKVMNQKNFISNVQICILKDKTGHPIIIYKIKSPKWSHSVILQS